jgi:phage gpG-like protein
MAGAGTSVDLLNISIEDDYTDVIEHLKRAESVKKRAVADFMGALLHTISMEAFVKETDPVTSKPWEPLKYPKKEGHKILQGRGTLKESLTWEADDDGTVVFGSNLAYARIHQEGGTTKAHTIKARNGKALAFMMGNKKVLVKSVKHPGSKIPARPYMGVPEDFGRRVLGDSAIKKLLGVKG